MKYLSLLILVLGFGGSLNVEGSVDSASKIWKEYCACARRTPQKDLVSCARPYLDSTLVAPEQNKMIQFLDMGFEFTALRECSTADKTQPLHASKSKYYCMEVQGKSTNGQGYVIFSKENDKLKIKSIKFKFY